MTKRGNKPTIRKGKMVAMFCNLIVMIGLGMYFPFEADGLTIYQESNENEKQKAGQNHF